MSGMSARLVFLTVDSPLFSIVLFKNRPFPWVSGGFLEIRFLHVVDPSFLWMSPRLVFGLERNLFGRHLFGSLLIGRGIGQLKRETVFVACWCDRRGMGNGMTKKNHR